MQNQNGEKLGEFLRSEREKRHITIEQIASATKINIKLLHALESDNYEALPAKPFVRGFVMNYVRYIGLEPGEVVSRFESFLDEQAGQKFKRPADAPHIFVEKDVGGGDQSRTVLSVIMASFLVVGLGIVLIVKPSMHKKHHSKVKAKDVSNESLYTVALPPQDGGDPVPMKQAAASPAAAAPVTPPSPTATASPTPTPTPTPKASPSVVSAPPLVLAPLVKPSPSPKTSPTPKVSPTPSPKASASPSPKPSPTATAAAVAAKDAPIPDAEVRHLLVVRAKEDSWVKYQPDNRKIMGFMLRGDKTIYIRARESIRFTTGKPSAIEYSYNRGPFQTLKESQRWIIVPTSVEDQYKDKPFTE